MRIDPERLERAIDDYLEFLARGYTDETIREVVSNRHRLRKPDRIALYRGVVAPEVAQKRTRKLIHADASPPPASGRSAAAAGPLLVDGHNVLYTVANYLRGVPLFLSTDGLLRDAGEVHGDEIPPRLVARAARLLVSATGELEAAVPAAVPRDVEIILDGRLPRSDAHRDVLEHATVAGGGYRVGVRTDSHPDRALSRARTGMVATSDGEIVDATGAGVLDLARFVIERHFAPTWVDLGEISARILSKRSTL